MRLIITLLLTIAATVLPVVAQVPPPYTAAIVLEPTTGRILFEKNSNQALPTASMIKMMTLLVVMDEIKEGTITLDTPVTVSAKASRMGGSQVFLKQGETFPVKDLIAATMVHSANDAAMALAERVGGTEEAFVPLMRTKAQQLGLKNTDIHSPHGLPAEGEDQPDVMSPADLARVGMEIMKFPLIRQLAVLQTMPFRGGVFIMNNPNRLLRMYPDATGIKTGYHGKAGFCVTASARRGNLDLIAVVVGSQRKQDNFESAANLFSEAFARYRMLQPVKKGTVMTGAARISGGSVDSVKVVAGDTANVLVDRGEGQKIELLLKIDTVKAPIRKFQKVGLIIVRQGGKPIAQIPALAVNDVARASLMQRLWPF